MVSVVTPAAASAPAIILQKECVISKSKKIAVGSFGPCYVLTGHDPKTKYTFEAHIDDSTEVASISKISTKLKELGVDLKDLTNVSLMGGWKSHAESNKWGLKVIEQLKKDGISNIDFTFFQQKATRPPGFKTSDRSELSKYYFPGGILDPATGKFQFFKTFWWKLEDKQTEATAKFQSELLEGMKISDFKASSPQEERAFRERFMCQLAMEKEFPLKVTVID